MKSNINVVKALGMAVTCGGIIVAVGWLFDVPALTSIRPEWVTMKFVTAVSFVCSGIILFSISKFYERKEEVALLGLALPTMLVLVLISPSLVFIPLDIKTGVESFIVQEEQGAVATTAPGRPSVGTMADFLGISAASVLTMFNLRKPRYIRAIGIAVLAVAAVAVIGYIANVETLYYSIAGASTAMALHTAIFFTALGTGLFLLSREKTVAMVEAQVSES
jgi:hypothetical protein